MELEGVNLFDLHPDSTVTGTFYGTPYSREVGEITLLDRRLRSYANQRAKLDAAEAFDLARAYDLKLHAIFGCATFYEYMERLLGYSPHTARERLRVSRALRDLPATAANLAEGNIAYSHVRELTRVAKASTEQAWLDATTDRNAAEVQSLVAGHAYGDLPDSPTTPDLKPRRLALEVPPEVVALWRESRAGLADELGIAEISDAFLMETLCRRFLKPGDGSDGPAQSIGYTKCTDCERTTVNGAGRSFDVEPEAVARVECDARSLGDLNAEHPERAVSSVTPRMREQVFARDQYRCQVPGCRSARHLEVHHIVEQARGGSHEMSNLVLICGGHHSLLHKGMISMSGTSPYHVTFQWTFKSLQPQLFEEPNEPGRRPRLPRWLTD